MTKERERRGEEDKGKEKRGGDAPWRNKNLPFPIPEFVTRRKGGDF